jgi:lysylphosphatidylglycerol synthetase-like protein (DUF2156 family)
MTDALPVATRACEISPSPRLVDVPVGGRVLVVSDLHLGREPTPGHLLILAELAQAIESWNGPGVVLFNGNTFFVGATKPGTMVPPGTCAAALAAYPRLVKAVEAFAAGPGRRVLVLPGDRDIHILWSGAERRALAQGLGAEVAMAVDLGVDTGAGRRLVRVDPGQRLDALTAYQDPSNAGESPLSQHLRSELFPAVRRSQGGERRRDDWLSGMEELDDPATFPRFIASRLVYRKLARRAWLLVVPVVLAIALRLPLIALTHATGLVHSGASRVLALLALSSVELVILGGLAVATVRRTWRTLSGLSAGEGDREPNQAARALTRQLIGDGYYGLVTGHTCRAELTDLGSGFYANSGCGAFVVTETATRLPGLGLPPVFLARRQISWVEIEAGHELRVRLFYAMQPAGDTTLLERIMARRSPTTPPAPNPHPQLVGSFPHGPSWPPPSNGVVRTRRIRRLAGLFVAAAGFISLLSSLSEPLRDRLDDLQTVLPLVVPETATALAALGGVALLVLARGVRRGQRRAWAVTIELLVVVAGLHIVKGIDVEEAIVALAVAAFLWVNRAEFQAASDTESLRSALFTWVVVAVATVLTGTIAVEVSTTIGAMAHRARSGPYSRPRPFAISWWHAFLATIGRMTADTSTFLPRSIERFFAPAMATATFGLLLGLAALVFRPVVAGRRRAAQTAGDGLARARGIVARHGSGTLDYFALRPDKNFWFWGDTVVAYAVYSSVCLVSPDPIGPRAEREAAWHAFRQFVDTHGWALGGLGVAEEWLPTYRATGMHDLYVGDEGVVRTEGFTLEGGRHKSLRQAVNRIAKHGYTISFHDPSQLDPELRAALGAVMVKSRQGDVERGFSMTLGRAFEPEDKGLLLAVVHAPEPAGAAEGAGGTPVAFCQYVPAPGIDGYSLDLMRRDDGEHPNGLIDFAVVQTIQHLRAQEFAGLGLNFATMRAVLAGETGDGLTPRIESWLLRRMGDSMQIESLWKFNAKFDPDWQPRYAVYDAPENALAVAVAIARAESFWELPLIGHFLVPPAADEPRARTEPPSSEAAVRKAARTAK